MKLLVIPGMPLIPDLKEIRFLEKIPVVLSAKGYCRNHPEPDRASCRFAGGRSNRGESGFTLVEILIALVLLAIGILVVVRAFPMSSRHSVEDRLRTQAIQYANEKMEQIAASVLAGGVLIPGSYGPESIRDTWTCAYRIEPMAVPLEDLSRVSVRVSWTRTRPDTVELVTYLGL